MKKINKYSSQQQKDNDKGRVTRMQNATGTCFHVFVRVFDEVCMPSRKIETEVNSNERLKACYI